MLNGKKPHDYFGETHVNVPVKTVSVIGVLTFAGMVWAAAEKFSAKADKTEVITHINNLELRVVDALDEREYTRYEEAIEEQQELLLENKRIPPGEREHADDVEKEQIEQRIEKFEKRQQRFENNG